MMTTFYGHTKEDEKSGQQLPKTEWQLLIDHLSQVSEMAARHAAKFGAHRLGEIAGLAHDLGKYSEAFQRRLDGGKEKVDHASAGAQQMMVKYAPMVSNLLAYVIAGHHGGLPNGMKGSPSHLADRLEKQDIPDYQAFSEEVTLPEISQNDCAGFPHFHDKMEAFTLQFFIRMLYSCLVDSDYIDTEEFMSPERAAGRQKGLLLADLMPKLDKKLQELQAIQHVKPSTINSARAEILEQCVQRAEDDPGLFTLTVPTGGGKTYSSLSFGMKHAVRHGKERIIYVIPYTSIIEQNAQVFRDVLGDDAILEHHSSFDYPEGSFDDWDDKDKMHRLASENWDRPVVVTTAVQFYESLFSNKGSRCRKLHRITNSIVILDEAQMLPLEFLKPCLAALAELVENYRVSVVFCTATQPAIGKYLPAGMKLREIMSDPITLQRLFKRVQVDSVGPRTDEQIAEEMSASEQALAIVNTRRHARLLYDRLAELGISGAHHLSARMCPAHRKKVLREIRVALAESEPCRVVSTQLIEAGVDVDFPLVLRSVTGVDSIAQAAGRCNREGRMNGCGRVIVFEPEPHGMPKSFEMVAGLTRGVSRIFMSQEEDLLSLRAIQRYFNDLYGLDERQLDTHDILARIHSGMDRSRLRQGELWLRFPFADLSADFHLIDSETTPIIVPYNVTALDLMRKAEKSRYPASYARMLQPYVVQIYQFERQAMKKENMLKQVGDFLTFLEDASFYDDEFGLKDAKEVRKPDSNVYIL